nr:hypothetical protein [Candidatus Sigynarchaeum springense]
MDSSAARLWEARSTGKFVAGTAELNERTMSAGLILIILSFLNHAWHYVPFPAYPSPSFFFWALIFQAGGDSLYVVRMVALFMLMFWGIDKHRQIVVAYAFISITLSSGLLTIIGTSLGNPVVWETICSIMNLVPWILLVGDAITKQEPRIMAAFLSFPTAAKVLGLVYVLGGIDALVVPQAAHSILLVVANIESYFVDNVILGLYFMVTTARGKQWLDKARVVAVLGAFGAFHVALSSVK